MEFAERVMHCEYPQYFLDSLPFGDVSRSFLRFDHLFAVGADPGAFEITEHCLSSEGLEYMHAWLEWVLEGVAPALLQDARELILQAGQIV